MHYLIGVILPAKAEGTAEEFKKMVEEALEPFNEHTEVAPYRVYLEKQDIQNVRRWYKKPRISEEKLVPFVADYYGAKAAGYDNEGLFYVSTYNPKSKWDCWELGGRWNGEVIGTPRSDNDGGFNSSDEYHTLQENMIKIGKIDHELVTYALLLPDGTWLERQEANWMQLNKTKTREELKAEDEALYQEWRLQVRETLIQHNTSFIIGVDIHI